MAIGSPQFLIPDLVLQFQALNAPGKRSHIGQAFPRGY